MRTILICVIVVLAAAAARAEDGVVKVAPVTGTDAAALAKRVRALEERLEAMWSLREGPEVLAIDTVDRLASRLLALETRTTTVEEATGVRAARASHGHGDGVFEVALALILLEDADWGTRASSAEGRARLHLLRQAILAAGWPEGLKAKVSQLDAAWKAWSDAVARADAEGAASELQRLALLRRDLVLSASNWVATMVAAEGKPHGHSGLSAGAHADHSPHHGGQVGMQGDVHVELVSEAPGRWRAFMTDAFRRPLSALAWSGAVWLEPGDEMPRRIELAPSADGASLEGSGDPAARIPVEAGVRFTAPADLAGSLGPRAVAAGDRSVAMDFAFLAEGPGGTGDAAPVHPPDCPMNPANLALPASSAPESLPSRSRRWRR